MQGIDGREYGENMSLENLNEEENNRIERITKVADLYGMMSDELFIYLLNTSLPSTSSSRRRRRVVIFGKKWQNQQKKNVIIFVIKK